MCGDDARVVGGAKRAGSPAVLLAATLALAACARQIPPPEPPRPAPRRAVPPAPPRPVARPSRPDAARAERDRRAEAVCDHRGSLVEDQVRDAGGAELGLDAVLAGQSARDTCLRDYRRTGEPPVLP